MADTRTIDSNTSDKTAIESSVWFKAESMTLDTNTTGYQGNKVFGIGSDPASQGRKFYRQLAEQLVDVTDTESLYQLFEGFNASIDSDRTRFCVHLAVIWNLAGMDDKDLTPDTLWKSELGALTSMDSMATIEEEDRIDVLCGLKQIFVALCHTMVTDVLIFRHMDFCKA